MWRTAVQGAPQPLTHTTVTTAPNADWALEAASGKTLRKFAGSERAEEILHVDGTIYILVRDGGWELNGAKSFGCATGIADQYLVAASLEGIDDASGLCTFLVDRDAERLAGKQVGEAIRTRLLLALRDR